jgi:hypothetical protein
MGWANGSELMDEVIKVIKPEIPDDRRVKVYRELIRAFEAQDADTLLECGGKDPAYDQAYCLENKLDYEEFRRDFD